MPVVDHHRYCTYIVLYYVRPWPISPPTGGLMPVAPLPYRYCTYHQRKAPARRLAYNGTPLAHSGLTALKIESVSEMFSQYVGGRQPTYRLRTHTDRIRILYGGLAPPQLFSLLARALKMQRSVPIVRKERRLEDGSLLTEVQYRSCTYQYGDIQMCKWFPMSNFNLLLFLSAFCTRATYANSSPSV